MREKTSEICSKKKKVKRYNLPFIDFGKTNFGKKMQKLTT